MDLQAVLVVVRPFGGRRVGDVIDEARCVRGVLSGEHAHDVVRVAAPVAAKQEE